VSTSAATENVFFTTGPAVESAPTIVSECKFETASTGEFLSEAVASSSIRVVSALVLAARSVPLIKSKSLVAAVGKLAYWVLSTCFRKLEALSLAAKATSQKPRELVSLSIMFNKL
jgi:hypothetical protein